MMNKKTARIVHVDFDCIFLRGETLGVPETVPFRFTQNIIDPMGVTSTLLLFLLMSGYNGVFRTVSEIVLTILRDNVDAVMSTMETFVYDPLTPLTAGDDRPSTLVGMRERINGIKKPHPKKKRDKTVTQIPQLDIPLSVEGMVETLIKEAINPKNLANMFYGWNPVL